MKIFSGSVVLDTRRVVEAMIGAALENTAADFANGLAVSVGDAVFSAAELIGRAGGFALKGDRVYMVPKKSELLREAARRRDILLSHFSRNGKVVRDRESGVFRSAREFDRGVNVVNVLIAAIMA